MRSKQKVFLFDWIYILLLAIYVMLPVSPLYIGTVSRDAGVFLYTGWRILQGDIPYLDVWDHKPPLIYYIDALGLWLGNGTLWGVWLIEWVCVVISLWLLIRIVREHLKCTSLIAYASALIYALTLPFFLDGGNLTTEYPLPLQFLLIFLFVDLYRSEDAGWREFLFGLVTGLIFFTRQNSIGIALASALILFVGLIHSPRLLAKKAAWMAAGFASISVLIVLYFYFVNGLGAMWDAAFQFNVLYADERGWGDRLTSLLRGASALSQTGLLQTAVFGWFASVLIFVRRVSRFDSFKSVMWLIVLALPVELALAAWPGRPRVPYYTSVLPVLAVLSAILFESIYGFLSERGEKGRVMGAVLVAVPLVFCLRASLGAATYQYQFSFDPQHARVVEFLQSNTSAEDYVLVVGAESAVNFAAQRESPTRFVYQYALVRPTYGDEERLLEFYTDILDKKPKYIIATRTEDLPVSIGVKQSELVRAAADEVGSRYRLREVIIDWLVWEYVGP